MNNDEAVELVYKLNLENDLNNGIVLFLRKDFEDNYVGRTLTDEEWDTLSKNLWDSAHNVAMDLVWEMDLGED